MVASTGSRFSWVLGICLVFPSLCSAVGAEPHWSFRPITRVAVPTTKTVEWIRSPIDAFVLARLETAGLALSPETYRTTLIRRVTLDLIGLPPTQVEVDAFVADEREDANERLVDRLLASPHYGERWTRVWLDLCHYGDTDGHLTDQLRPVAWRYRDWVMRALNSNMPFDEFTVSQLAGDLVDAEDRGRRHVEEGTKGLTPPRSP